MSLSYEKVHANAKVEDVPLDDFLSTRDDAGFEGLRKALDAHLSDVKAFRVGEVDVHYFVVGRTPQGDWAGVSAKAVEI